MEEMKKKSYKTCKISEFFRSVLFNFLWHNIPTFFSDKTNSHTSYPLSVSTSASLSNTRKWLLPIAGSITIVAPSLHPNMENRRRIINRADIFSPWMSQRWTNVTKVNRGHTIASPQDNQSCRWNQRQQSLRVQISRRYIFQSQKTRN